MTTDTTIVVVDTQVEVVEVVTPGPQGPAGPQGDQGIRGLKGDTGDVGPAADTTSTLLGWAYSQAFELVSATRDANEIVTTASIVWPDGATGTFTTDAINTTFNAIDAWHVTYSNGAVNKTLTQTAVTRDAAGGVTAQPAITIT